MRKLVMCLLLLSVVSLCSYSSFASASFTTYKKPMPIMTMKNSLAFQAITELGEFTKDNVVYAVYGDASTGEVTDVYFYPSLAPVYSFYPTYVYGAPPSHPWYIALYFKPDSLSDTLLYDGILLYY